MFFNWISIIFYFFPWLQNFVYIIIVVFFRNFLTQKHLPSSFPILCYQECDCCWYLGLLSIFSNVYLIIDFLEVLTHYMSCRYTFLAWLQLHVLNIYITLSLKDSCSKTTLFYSLSVQCVITKWNKFFRLL